MEIKKYWWEDELDSLLHDHLENEYLSNADIKLFILKVINTEKGENLHFVYNQRDIEEIKLLRSQGLSLRAIANKVNIKHPQTVSNLIKK